MKKRDRYDRVIEYFKKLSVNNSVVVRLRIGNGLLQKEIISERLQKDLTEETSNYNMSLHVPSLLSNEEYEGEDNKIYISIIKQRGKREENLTGRIFLYPIKHLTNTPS